MSEWLRDDAKRLSSSKRRVAAAACLYSAARARNNINPDGNVRSRTLDRLRAQTEIRVANTTAVAQRENPEC
jgi:hypothetical protein